MNNLIIIGNGFDLAHNMKTSYKNFITYIISSQINDKTKYYDLLYIQRGLLFTVEDFYKQLKRGSSSGIKFKNRFFHSLVLDLTLNNWCDIEKKYFDDLNNIVKSNGRIDDFHEEFRIVRKYLISYLRGENEKDVKILNSFSTIFNKLKMIATLIF